MGKRRSRKYCKKAVTISKVDLTAPTASITSTNNVAATQTATLNLSDNVGVQNIILEKQILMVLMLHGLL